VADNAGQPVSFCAGAGSSMKILYIISGLKYGGAEKLLYYTCKGLKARYPVTIDVICLDPAVGLAPLFAEIQVPVVIFKKNPFVLLKLFKLISRERYDIVHTHLIHADTFGRTAALLCRILYHPLIFSTTHDNYWFRWQKSIRGHLVRMVDRWLALAEDSQVLPVSPAIQRTLLQHEKIPTHKVTLLLNAVEIPRNFPKRERDASTGLHCLFIGRFIDEKNIPCLLRALKLISDESITCTLVGEGPLESNIKSMIKELKLQKQINLVKPVTDPERLYRQHDVLVLPSHLEGLPMVILEAFSRRLPVIGADIPGIRELLSDNRGQLFPNNDSKALARALEQMKSGANLYSTMVEFAFEYVCKNHSIDGYCEKLFEFYQGKW
jgi:glycosyltransferase involved in cell wall biosynthesis